MNLFLKLEQYRSRVFFLFLVCAVVGYFGKDNFKSSAIPEMVPEVFTEPIQMPVVSKDPIRFEKDGFSYTLTPLYNYTISGLVVHRMDYDVWYSLSRTDKTFTTDVCMLWGDNIKTGAYKNETLKIDQDFRFCLFNYQSGPPLKNEALSNNHLIIRDADVKRINNEISPGDQIRITGKLVNVRAVSEGEPGKYEPKTAEWTTSTTRLDSSGGACEILYVEKIEILKKGNAPYHTLYNIGKDGVLLVILWLFVQFIRSVILTRRGM